MGGVKRTANQAIGGDTPIKETGTGFQTVTPNTVNSTVAQMMSAPRDQWPDLSKWGPNSLNMLEARYRETSRNDLNNALKVANGLRTNDNRVSISDIKNPELAAMIESANITSATSAADFRKLQQSLSQYQTNVVQDAVGAINEGRLIPERGPAAASYQKVTVNDAQRTAADFAHKPSEQWPDISKWGQNAVTTLRTDYKRTVADDLVQARQVLANNGKGIEDIQNPTLRAVLDEIQPGMSAQDRDKISNHLTAAQTMMNASVDAVFTDRLTEIRGGQAPKAAPPPTAPRPNEV